MENNETNVIEGELVERYQSIDPITQAEIDVAITTAKRYPRNLSRFKDEVRTMATMDQETAEGCFYSLKRSGKVIQGPTVRFAEMCVSAWGNIRSGARIIGETEDGRFIRALGVCHDLEKNVYIAMECQRRITNKKGERYNDDLIGVTANAAAAIAMRNAIFKVVPRAMVQQAYLSAVSTATGKLSSLTDKRNGVIARLQKLSPHITLDKILAAVEKPSVDNITAEDVTHLIGLGTAIKEGEETVEQAFPGDRREDAIQRLLDIVPGLTASHVLEHIGRDSVDDVTDDDVADLIDIGKGITSKRFKAEEVFALVDDDDPDPFPPGEDDKEPKG